MAHGTRRVRRDPRGEDWETYYRRYQRTLATSSLIPLLTRWGVELRGARVLEAGCGNGGCGAALAEAGSLVTMVDLDPRMAALAQEHNAKEGIDARVLVADVADEEAPCYGQEPFDLVVFRDVMEHLEDPVRVLEVVRRHLGPNGRVFVEFPPYYSPYGGHQQILPRRTVAGIPYNKLPYLQLLPTPLFMLLTRGSGRAHEEVARLRGIRLTIAAFERIVREAGYVAVARSHYLSRPSHAVRWGLPVIPAVVLGRLPLVREVLVSAAVYLLGRDADRALR